MSEQCSSCRFWALDDFGRALGGYHTDGGYSQCRRHAPIFTGDAQRDCYFAGKGTAWPYTAKDAWCGDYQPRPDDFVTIRKEVM